MALLDTTKLLYTALGVGVVGGTGAGAYYYLSNSDSKKANTSITPKNEKTDIATKLSEEKYELLESGASDWEQILTSYKNTVKANKNLMFGDFDGTKPEQDTQKELQRLCNEATKLDSSKDTNNTYNKAKKWCTKPRTLTNVLEGKGYRLLDSKDVGDPEKELWQAKLEDHERTTTNADKKFASLGLVSEGTSNKDVTNRGKLREKCRALKEKDRKHYEQEFETELDQAILWCSKNN